MPNLTIDNILKYQHYLIVEIHSLILKYKNEYYNCHDVGVVGCTRFVDKNSIEDMLNYHNEMLKCMILNWPIKEESNMLYKEQEYNKKNKCCLEPDDLVEIEKKRTGSIELEIEKCTKLLIALNENIEILAAKLVPILSQDSVDRKSADESEPHKCCNIATILSSFNCEIEDSIDKIKEIVERIEL